MARFRLFAIPHISPSTDAVPRKARHARVIIMRRWVVIGLASLLYGNSRPGKNGQWSLSATECTTRGDVSRLVWNALQIHESFAAASDSRKSPRCIAASS